MNICIDGSRAERAQHKLFRGNGMVSANNSSRLLLDYKAEHPEQYWKILEYLFGENALCINHLKIEMGSDINSSSGTEPSVKRSKDEKANVRRGAGFVLASDAKKINPQLTLDMLWWSEPRWVSDEEAHGAQALYKARYSWYKETLDEAFFVYGLRFDYVSATQNERADDPEWVSYLAQRLKEEKDCPYNYADIKIVAGDETCTWFCAEKMITDARYRDAVSVIGSHYTSWASENAKRLANEYGKEVWFSEASSPMCYSQGKAHFPSAQSSLSGLNGTLDIASRFITMFYGAYMTLCEYQPAVAAYYDGVCYCQKQLILANEPWNGSFVLDSGFFMALHFSLFIKKGWSFIPSACFSDATASEDGHGIASARFCYMTACSPQNDNYTCVLVNMQNERISYDVRIENMAHLDAPVFVWETRGPTNPTEAYNAHYVRHIRTITPTLIEENGASRAHFGITLEPFSLVTLTTLRVVVPEYTSYHNHRVLPLPYKDDFLYADFGADYLFLRAGAPRYMTDQGGAFEVCQREGRAVLMQLITEETKAKEWGATPEPTTTFGDDRWCNYRATVNIALCKTNHPHKNYAGIGVRYILASDGKSGWSVTVSEDGIARLFRGNTLLLEKRLSEQNISICAEKWFCLAIEADHDSVRAFLDNATIFSYTARDKNEPFAAAGRGALFSSYNKNCFSELVLEPLYADFSVQRFDDTDTDYITYAGDWAHEFMESFKNYKRTVSYGKKGASFAFSFCAQNVFLFGKQEAPCTVQVELDGTIIEDSCTIPLSSFREVFYANKTSFSKENHTVRVTVVDGTLSLDGIEII